MSDQQMNESQNPEVAASMAPPPPVAPGSLLAAQRQARGWSVEQVASQLKLAPRQVVAIEADNFGALPGLAIARGFVRAYAKLMGMDASALLLGLPQDGPAAQRDAIVPQRSLSTPFSQTPLPNLGNRGSSGGSAAWIAAGVVVVVLLAGAGAVRWGNVLNDVPQLAWLKTSQSDASAVATPEAGENANAAAQTAPAAAESSTELPANARVELTNGASTENASKIEAPAASVPATPAVASVPPPAAMPAPVQAPLKPLASSAPAANIPAVGENTSAAESGLKITSSKDLLRLTLREDSWVEIRRADKTTIISRLLKAGSTETFDVSDASALVIGNAAGVDASLRGQPLDLKVSNGGNVARLNLN
jgi:cytoskeleton protein RodZ